MPTLKLHSTAEFDLAMDLAQTIGSDSQAGIWVGMAHPGKASTLQYADEDADLLELVARDAAAYWQRMKRPAKAAAAEAIRAAVATERIRQAMLR